VKVKLLYFASLADRAGCSEETRETGAANPRDLYAEVARAHAFALAPERVRVAVNGALANWERALAEGDEVVFLPPVSGG
jgi:sulfur-carrier protein